MVNCAKKYGIKFDTLNPSKDVRELLPLWHHFGEDPNKRQLNNKPQCKCLRVNHRVTTVGDGMSVMARLNDPIHEAHKKCICAACSDDRIERKCKNPHSCATAVQTRLGQLLPKWDPRVSDLQEEENPDEGENTRVFIGPEEISKLTDGFRVFTNAPDPVDPSAAQVVAVDADSEDMVVVAFSGHTEHGGTADAKAAIAIFYGEGDPRNESGTLPEDLGQSTSNAEIAAAARAIQRTP
ncbi:hypothetical protein C8R46DRAFT_927518, partial [Mycena filopes]